MPKPKLGQNFLIDAAACLRIADSLGDVSARTVVEIGPGHGAITGPLAARAARLHCIEFDPALARELTFRFRNDPHVTIHQADILQTDLATLAGNPENGTTHKLEHWNTGTLEDWNAGKPESWSTDPLATPNPKPETESKTLLPTSYFLLPASLDIVGNLPYYITSDILLHLFAAARQGVVARAVLMMQREVAGRIAAAPGHSDYGALSALTQLHAQVTNLFTLPPSAFSPPPEVYSTVLRLDFAPRFAELGIDPGDFENFNRFLRTTFAQKRKTLANNLRSAGYTAAQLHTAWPTTLDPQARSEAVPLETMATLYRNLKSRE